MNSPKIATLQNLDLGL